MPKFELSGFQRDMVNSLAIHQDTPGLVAFIEDLVNEQIAANSPLPDKSTLTQFNPSGDELGKATVRDPAAIIAEQKEVPSGQAVDGGTQKAS